MSEFLGASQPLREFSASSHSIDTAPLVETPHFLKPDPEQAWWINAWIWIWHGFGCRASVHPNRSPDASNCCNWSHVAQVTQFKHIFRDMRTPLPPVPVPLRPYSQACVKAPEVCRRKWTQRPCCCPCRLGVWSGNPTLRPAPDLELGGKDLPFMPPATLGAGALPESQGAGPGAEPGAGDPLLPAEGEADGARALAGIQAGATCRMEQEHNSETPVFFPAARPL